MRNNSDKVIADLELLRDDALTDETPTAALWLDRAIVAIRERDREIRLLHRQIKLRDEEATP